MPKLTKLRQILEQYHAAEMLILPGEFEEGMQALAATRVGTDKAVTFLEEHWIIFDS